MATSIWGSNGGVAATPAATNRIPTDISSGGAPNHHTLQQLADLGASIGVTTQALGSINTNTTITWSSGSYVTATIAGALTFTFAGAPSSGQGFQGVLVLTNGGSAVITWPVSVTWSGGTAPTLRASGVDLLRFYTEDNGTTWFGTSENDEPDTTNTPGGSATELQYRSSATTFGGMAGTEWDNTNRALTITGATVTTSNPVLNVSQTWNAGAVTFTGLQLNVTDTASASGSLLQDWKVGGASVASISKSGAISTPSTITASAFYPNYGGTLGWTSVAGSNFTLTLRAYNSNLVAVTGSGAFPTLGIHSGVQFAWSSTTSPDGTKDVLVARDAAGALAQRNGTNAQTFRVYRSYTDASNYSRWTVKWNTSTAILHAEGAGTGTDGSVAFNDAALATDATRGFLMIPSCAGTPTGTPADIPTGQAPIVYDSTNKKLAVWDGAAWVQTAALT